MNTALPYISNVWFCYLRVCYEQKYFHLLFSTYVYEKQVNIQRICVVKYNNCITNMR